MKKPLRPTSATPAGAAALATSLMLISLPAAADIEKLLEKLHQKGVLSQAEYEEMRLEVRAERRAAKMEKALEQEKLEKQKAAAGSALAGIARDSFTFTSGDGQHSIRLTGRANIDYRDADNGYSGGRTFTTDRDTASIADTFELRRARIGLTGFVYKDIGFDVQMNAVGNAPTVDTAFLNLGYVKPLQFRFGRFKQPFSLEELTSSNDIDFAERSYVNQLVPAKKIGAMVHGEPLKGISYAASIFQQGFDEETQEDGRGKRFAARATANVADLAGIDDSVVHLGLAMVGGKYELRPASSSQTSGAASTTTRATVVAFRSMNRGIANVYRAQIGGELLGAAGFNTPSEFGVSVDQDLAGAEFALARGPFKLQGEYVRADYNALNPIGGQTVGGDVKTYYLQALWNLTGEKWADAYRGGVFRGIKPKANFAPGGGWGAWQLGLRFSRFDATGIKLGAVATNSREQSGGLAAASDRNDIGRSMGLGVNWVLNPMTRFMFEWTKTRFGGETVPLDVTAAGTTGITRENLISVRGQVNF